MSESAASALVDRVLGAAGGGRVLCVGPDGPPLVAAFRRRAVDASACEAWPDTGAVSRLPCQSKAFDLVSISVLPGAPGEAGRAAMIQELLRVARRGVLVQSTGHARESVEREWLAHACRKHPLHQLLAPYDGLDQDCCRTISLFEPLPVRATIGVDLGDLAAGRDLHMDMLREAGRRADAHVARYMLARQFLRPGDRVLDAACGLGYGCAILADGSLADSVLGIDNDEAAIAYASAHYGDARSRVSFEARDVLSVADLPSRSLDAVVCFETLEHVPDPEAFLAACTRALTPAGRIICSVPNLWLNGDGIDPNPYHLQVFDRERLERMCQRHFLIEHTYGQTAGGGMKLPNASRRLWEAAPGEQEAEWWLVVGMTGSSEAAAGPVRHGLTSGPVDDRTNVLAFDRDYANPWLVRSMITIGLRTRSEVLLDALAGKTLAAGEPASPDSGAALCVQAYRQLERGAPLDADLHGRIERYTSLDASVPHVLRWQVSLRYVLALSHLQQGAVAHACLALEACAGTDALTFSPLLATKTVGAAFLRGWVALQAGDIPQARRWWTAGVRHAERALHRPWTDMLLDRDAPALFGLREAAVIVDLASQCATGLALSNHAEERPGLVASQLFESLRDRADRHAAVPPQEAISRAAGAALDHVRRAAVFGSGAAGRLALDLAARCGWTVPYLVDNNPAVWNTTAHERPVRAPHALWADPVDLVIVGSLAGGPAIASQLEGMGLVIGQDFVHVLDPIRSGGLVTQAYV